MDHSERECLSIYLLILFAHLLFFFFIFGKKNIFFFLSYQFYSRTHSMSRISFVVLSTLIDHGTIYIYAFLFLYTAETAHQNKKSRSEATASAQDRFTALNASTNLFFFVLFYILHIYIFPLPPPFFSFHSFLRTYAVCIM